MRTAMDESDRTLTLVAGMRVGPYEVVAPLGVGGMGEVYRAKDTRLNRTVAIKLLPRPLAADAQRRQRFEREARAISQLNHPHICTLHDIGETAIAGQAPLNDAPVGTVPYLVMECLEGETLAQRLARGRLPLGQVLHYAVQIADALDAAHRHGIVHRDLKPANVMLTEVGAKLLDFGIARLTAAADIDSPHPDRSMDSVPATLTVEGMVVGTTPYMSPEQLAGRPPDGRSDLFAFGAVLYEMLAGRRAFDGDSQAAVVAAVLDLDPPPINASVSIPPALEHLITTCLAKDVQDRWQNAGDVKRQLEWIAAQETSAVMPAGPSLDPRVGRWPAAALLSVLVAGAGLVSLRPTPEAAGTFRFTLSVPQPRSLQEPGFALSPDGFRLAFVAPGATGEDVVWVRHLDSLEAQPISGSDGAYSPFWSPDSESIAYFANGKLMRVPARGGAPQALCDVSTPAVAPAGAWSSSGWIVFAQAFGPLHRVSELGGEVTPVTRLHNAGHEFGHYRPVLFPDGERFLYYGNSTQGSTGIHVGSLRTQQTQRLSQHTTVEAATVVDGHFLFVEQGFLKAQKLDLSRLELTGNPVAIGEAAPFLAISTNGTVAYRPPTQALTQLAWFDRAGERLERIAQAGLISAPALSPDGTKVALGRDGDIWVLDLVRRNETRLTTDANLTENWPVWSPDGKQILYSRSSGSGQLVRKPASGAGMEEPVVGAEGIPYEWSRDGRFVTYFAAGQNTQGDLYVVPMTGSGRPVIFLQTTFQEVANRLSPGGNFMTYTSNESGRMEVYVQTFPASDNKWLISTAGGSQPIWSQDGRELFYLAPDGTLMAVDVQTAPTFAAGVPRPLFKTNSPQGPVRNSYAPSPDGKRFLVNSYVEGGTSTIVVLLNWRRMIPS